MSPVSPLWAIAAVSTALICAFLLVRHIGIPAESGRYVSIDGLRGYAAFFVFLHHSAIWYFFLRSGLWRVPPSNLYTHFGQSGVVFFFMITGFLFSSKLINARSKPINWLQLYISRFLRLVPLYLFCICIMFGIVTILSHFQIHESLFSIIKEFVKWSSFAISGSPNINGIHNTGIIVAGVFWTLPYEIAFYLGLPILSILILLMPPFECIILTVSSLMIEMSFWRFPNRILVIPFAAGIISAFIVRWSAIRTHLSGKIGSLVALSAIVPVVALFPTAYNRWVLLGLAVAFCIFACGNTLFGIRSSPLSRMLGELSYSIYLLQGIILFVTFKFIVGFQRAATFSPLEHWLTILCCTVFLIPFCSLTFRYIEAPAMRAVPNATAWVQEWLNYQIASGKSVWDRGFGTVKHAPHDDRSP
ncbi:MAG: acyltransferase [Syntrophobacteraceae bacterium]|nr:acyltransferase [Syntrophobacteraceae bacterium]